MILQSFDNRVGPVCYDMTILGMALHRKSTKIEKRLRIERSRQLVGSAMLAMGSVTMVLAVLSLFMQAQIHRQASEPSAMTFCIDPKHKPKALKKADETQLREVVLKPASAPPSRASRPNLITAPTELPLPDYELTAATPSVDMGVGEDFGGSEAKWYRRGKPKGHAIAVITHQEGTLENGEGMEGGAVTFFGTSSPARRVAYVIDFSKSMRSGPREALMRHELSRSVGALDDDMEYQLIFFCGFPWVGGGRVEESKWRDKRAVTITSSDGLEFELVEDNPYSNRFELRDKRKAHKPGWLKASEIQKERSLAHIDNTSIVPQWGTNWEPAFEMAMQMHPKPDVIVFLTDGVYGGNPQRVGEKIGNKAKSQGVTIHAVSMLEPKAKDALLRMAELTGGSFTEIAEKGSTNQPSPTLPSGSSKD